MVLVLRRWGTILLKVSHFKIECSMDLGHQLAIKPKNVFVAEFLDTSPLMTNPAAGFFSLTISLLGPGAPLS